MLFGAGIVLYNPEIERLRRSLNSISKQVDLVLLVDNGSDNIDQVLNLVSKYETAKVIVNNDNLGIARALNQIFEVSVELGYEWIMTLDQDTVLCDGTIQNLKPLCKEEKVGIVCPVVNYEGWSNSLPSKTGYEDIYACMTSGSLTSVEAWIRVGGFEESYFIDYVDNEFCIKLKNRGYRIVRVFSCVMSHQLGESKELCVFGKKIQYAKHSPIRCYYMTRNNLRFIKTYRDYINVPKEYCKVLYLIIMNLLFCDDFRETRRMIQRGIRDYRLNVMGKLK